MSFRITFILLLFVFISCKNEIKSQSPTNDINSEQLNKPNDTLTNQEKPIQVRTVIFDSTKSKTNTEKISTVTKKIQQDFITYPFNKDSNEIKYTRQKYQSKAFLETLVKSFNNKDFLDIAAINYSYVLAKGKEKLNYISIEEWLFKDDNIAKSSFESLKKYNETDIYFKSINWIWAHQKDKIYLIFSTDYNVKDAEMQAIKKELINTISLSGEYESIQFYE